MKNRNKSFLHHSIVKVQIVASKVQALFFSQHIHYTTFPSPTQGGLEKFFENPQNGRCDWYCPSFPDLKRIVPNFPAPHRVEIVERLTLDLWFIQHPQRETCPDKRSLSLSHAHCWASSFNSVVKEPSLSSGLPDFKVQSRFGNLGSSIAFGRVNTTQYIKILSDCKEGLRKIFGMAFFGHPIVQSSCSSLCFRLSDDDGMATIFPFIQTGTLLRHDAI